MIKTEAPITAPADPNLTTGSDGLPFDKQATAPLKSAEKPLPTELTPAMVLENQVDPMIGMDGIVPADC